MAIEDYFEGASQKYGQLAGSLLAGRRREDKKRAERALIASAILSGFGALQNNQKRKIIDATEDLRERYDISTLGRKEMYLNADAVNNRETLRNYNNAPDQTIQELTDKYYDESNFAKTNNLTVGTRALITDENIKQADQAFYDQQKEKANTFISNIKENPLYSASSFEDYNEAYYNEYKAALAQIEDDPTKTSILRAAVNKIFPKAFDQKEAELEHAFKTATELRQQQERRTSDFAIPRGQIYSKAEALDQMRTFIETNNINDELGLKMLESLDSQPDHIGLTKNQIFSRALSTTVVNSQFLPQAEKEFKTIMEKFDLTFAARNNISVAEIDKSSPEYIRAKESELDKYLGVPEEIIGLRQLFTERDRIKETPEPDRTERDKQTLQYIRTRIEDITRPQYEEYANQAVVKANFELGSDPEIAAVLFAQYQELGKISDDSSFEQFRIVYLADIYNRNVELFDPETGNLSLVNEIQQTMEPEPSTAEAETTDVVEDVVDQYQFSDADLRGDPTEPSLLDKDTPQVREDLTRDEIALIVTHNDEYGALPLDTLQNLFRSMDEGEVQALLELSQRQEDFSDKRAENLEFVKSTASEIWRAIKDDWQKEQDVNRTIRNLSPDLQDQFEELVKLGNNKREALDILFGTGTLLAQE